MPDTTIGEVLARQFDRMWDGLRDAVGHCPDEQWRTSECDWLAPARQAYHLVETTEFYSLLRPEEASEPLDWDNGPADGLPSRAQLLTYIDRVQPVVRAWLMNCGDDTFLAEDAAHPRTGGTRLDRAIYSLRHAQHHLGQINSELRRKGLPRGKWD